MTNLMKKISILIFIACLIIPPITWFALIDEDQKSNIEKRDLLEFPDLTQTEWSSFFTSIEDWYVDNAPFKSVAVSIKNTISTKLFNEVDSTNVIYGNNEWLFYKGVGDGDSLADYKGQVSITDNEIESYKNTYLAAQENLAAQNIEIYQLVVPNKEIALSEYMPNTIKRIDDTSVATQVESYMHSEGIDSFDYLYDEMTNCDDSPYYKLDTHWNLYGAYEGYKSLLSMMDVETPNADIEFVNAGQRAGDLSNMICLNMNEPYNYSVVNGFKYTDSSVLTSGSAYIKLFESNASNPNEDSVLLIGDSFRERFEDYIAQDFASTISVHRDLLETKEFQDLEFKPNTIILISPERYLMRNLSTLEWLSQVSF